LIELIEPLPQHLHSEILQLWDEYDAASSTEARIAKGLDKLETILQHNQGRNPPGFDYAFNLDYGARYTALDPIMVAVRQSLDQETTRNAEKNT
jgi:putative hydrolase of HD superfamily